MKFACTDNSNRVVYNKKILIEYESVSEWNDALRVRLRAMDQTWNRKILECDTDPIFIESCRQSVDKLIIVDEKEDYETYEWITTMFNKDEALSHLSDWRVIINNFGWKDNTSIIWDHNVV